VAPVAGGVNGKQRRVLWRPQRGWRGTGAGLERGWSGAGAGLERGWSGAGEGLQPPAYKGLLLSSGPLSVCVGLIVRDNMKLVRAVNSSE